jgi:hypothetical protein
MKIFAIMFIVFFTAAAGASAANLRECDFNDDGYEDLVIGVQEQFPGNAGQGFIHVLYGRSSGLTITGNQVWHANSSGLLGDPPDFGEFFGSALACGDYDNDSYSDLAIHSSVDGGQVHVLYGSATGLTATGNQLWRWNSPGITGASAWGGTLASGDFNGDSYSDLAIAAQDPFVFGGAVSVLYGSSSGLSSSKYQFWTQNSPGIADSSENGDGFGGVLVAGNFGKDSATRCYDDLAISVQNESFGELIGEEESEFEFPSAGAVHVIYGSSSGLTSAGSQFFHQDTSGIADQREGDDGFGESLAAGSFGGRTSSCGGKISDLAIGVPSENSGTGAAQIINTGAVHVLYATTSGLSTSGSQLWTQNTSNVLDSSEEEDFYGSTLATGRTSTNRSAP